MIKKRKGKVNINSSSHYLGEGVGEKGKECD